MTAINFILDCDDNQMDEMLMSGDYFFKLTETTPQNMLLWTCMEDNCPAKVYATPAKVIKGELYSHNHRVLFGDVPQITPKMVEFLDFVEEELGMLSKIFQLADDQTLQPAAKRPRLELQDNTKAPVHPRIKALKKPSKTTTKENSSQSKVTESNDQTQNTLDQRKSISTTSLENICNSKPSVHIPCFPGVLKSGDKAKNNTLEMLEDYQAKEASHKKKNYKPGKENKPSVALKTKRPIKTTPISKIKAIKIRSSS